MQSSRRANFSQHATCVEKKQAGDCRDRDRATTEILEMLPKDHPPKAFALVSQRVVETLFIHYVQRLVVVRIPYDLDVFKFHVSFLS